MTLEQVGFPDFAAGVFQDLGSMLDTVPAFRQIEGEMFQRSVSGGLPSLAREITRTVANSMQSVLLLVCNGCGIDAMKVARTMFEPAVTLHYLEGHPELAQDFMDFLWIKRKKHHEYLIQFAPNLASQHDPASIRHMESEYSRVKHRFMNSGKVRNNWSRLSLRDMANEVGAEGIYGGIYGFTSSMTHGDVLSIVAGAENSDEVEPVPSKAHLVLAIQMAVVSYAMTLTAFDQIGQFGLGDRLESAFTYFKQCH